MKVRIYKLENGEVIVDSPSSRYQDRISECPHPGRLRDGLTPFTMEVMDVSDLEALCAGTNEAGSGQFYHENGTLKHDNDWSELLMAPELIRIKQRKRLKTQLDSELDKETPDPVKALKLSRELERLKKMTDKELYQRALDVMDAEGINKPKIRQKLRDKLR